MSALAIVGFSTFAPPKRNSGRSAVPARRLRSSSAFCTASRCSSESCCSVVMITPVSPLFIISPFSNCALAKSDSAASRATVNGEKPRQSLNGFGTRS